MPGVAGTWGPPNGPGECGRDELVAKGRGTGRRGSPRLRRVLVALAHTAVGTEPIRFDGGWFTPKEPPALGSRRCLVPLVGLARFAGVRRPKRTKLSLSPTAALPTAPHPAPSAPCGRSFLPHRAGRRPRRRSQCGVDKTARNHHFSGGQRARPAAGRSTINATVCCATERCRARRCSQRKQVQVRGGFGGTPGEMGVWCRAWPRRSPSCRPAGPAPGGDAAGGGKGTWRVRVAPTVDRPRCQAVRARLCGRHRGHADQPRFVSASSGTPSDRLGLRRGAGWKGSAAMRYRLERSDPMAPNVKAVEKHFRPTPRSKGNLQQRAERARSGA